jgi:hypothetical protein
MNNLREELSHHSWHAISPQETSQSSQIVEAKVKVSICPKRSSHTPSHIQKGILIAFVLPACIQMAMSNAFGSEAAVGHGILVIGPIPALVWCKYFS